MGSPNWEAILEDATERVQNSVSAIAAGRDRNLVVGTGASGDKTLLADRAAEDELISALTKVQGLKVLSEEAGNRGDEGSRLTAIVDPLDGSSNFKRGIPFYCTSVAIAEGSSMGGVFYGIVRNLLTGDVYSAHRGKGATKNGRRIRTSSTRVLKRSVLGIDMSRAEASVVKSLGPLVAAGGRQLHFGANALELCFLAEGRIDGFVDLRGKMRITDFAAGYLIAKEAGAVITGPGGARLAPAFDLQDRFSYVGAANSTLHKKILGLTPGATSARR